MAQQNDNKKDWLREARGPPGFPTSRLLGTGSNLINNTSLTLEDLKAMFDPNVDSEIVDMIWQNCNQDGALAFGYLNEMSPVKPKQLVAPPPVTPPINTGWSKPLNIDTTKPFTEPPSVRPKLVVAEPRNHIAEVIKERVQRNERILIIMRGVPGCGKSHLARQMQGNGVVLSTDDYFINHQGVYEFKPRFLPEAHDWNRGRADRELKAGSNPVIIDNTNLEAWEMQPYIHLALRYAYAVELVEPDTPWRNDVRILSQKNTHGVPRDKIALMLEKQRVQIDIVAVVEDCRRKMQNLYPANIPPPISSQPPERRVGDQFVEPTSTAPKERTRSTSSSSSSSSSKGPHSVVSSTLSTPIPVEPVQPSAFPFAPTAEAVPVAQVASVGIQTSLSDPALKTLVGRSRSIQSSRLAPNFSQKIRSKITLDKGCNTEDVVEDLATKKALGILKSYFPSMESHDLADVLKNCNGDLTWAVNLLLDSGYECAQEVVADDVQLEDEEEMYGSDLEMRPFDGLPSSAEGIPTQNRDDEVNYYVSSEASSQPSSSVPSASSEDVESIRKHIEECFQLTDTISDQARRICGKDYNQFKASQLSKSRHNQASGMPSPKPSNQNLSDIQIHNNFMSAGFPLLGEQAAAPDGRPSSDLLGAEGGIELHLDHSFQGASPPTSEEEERTDGGAMIPMALDPSFVKQLVALFGAPDLKTGGSAPTSSNEPVRFDIPYSLAEQIYMHWCSSLIDEEDDERFEEESRELQSIMDIEYAMKIAQEEKAAQQKELRESLSTKMSLQMLRENYPQVAPLALEAIFEAHNYNYSHAVTALNASLGAKPHPHKPFEQPRPPPEEVEERASSSQKRDEPKVESSDLRSEAFKYKRLRDQFSAKAHENRQRGMAAVAAYYASESRRYAELYKEYNQQAFVQIAEEKNARQDERTIDLHELHVPEALALLESTIAENQRDGKTVIQVITGKGNHSVNGRARIKPAVITFIKQKKYGYEEINPGMLRVFLRPTTRPI